MKLLPPWGGGGAFLSPEGKEGLSYSMIILGSVLKNMYRKKIRPHLEQKK